MVKELSNEKVNWIIVSGKEGFEKELREIARKEGMEENTFVQEFKMEMLEVGKRIGDKIIITPELFKNVFMLVLSEFERQMVNRWYSPGQFTERIIGNKSSDKSMLHIMARVLRLQYYREYWSLDAVFFDKLCGKEGETLLNPSYICAEYLPVIIEHENNIKDSSLEMNKLSIFNSPLKVLITYPEGQDKNAYLNAYAAILKKADIFDDFSTKRKHLVVFGRKENKRTSWEFFLYKNRDWSNIK